MFFFFHQDKDVFDSKKKLKMMSANGLEHKLSSKQQEMLEMNKGLFNLFTNQVCFVILLRQYCTVEVVCAEFYNRIK